MKFETGQTSAPTSANISIARDNDVGPTMLRVVASVCTGLKTVFMVTQI